METSGRALAAVRGSPRTTYGGPATPIQWNPKERPAGPVSKSPGSKVGGCNSARRTPSTSSDAGAVPVVWTWRASRESIPRVWVYGLFDFDPVRMVRGRIRRRGRLIAVGVSHRSAGAISHIIGPITVGGIPVHKVS